MELMYERFRQLAAPSREALASAPTPFKYSEAFFAYSHKPTWIFSSNTCLALALPPGLRLPMSATSGIEIPRDFFAAGLALIAAAVVFFFPIARGRPG